MNYTSLIGTFLKGDEPNRIEWWNSTKPGEQNKSNRRSNKVSRCFSERYLRAQDCVVLKCEMIVARFWRFAFSARPGTFIRRRQAGISSQLSRCTAGIIQMTQR